MGGRTGQGRKHFRACVNHCKSNPSFPSMLDGKCGSDPEMFHSGVWEVDIYFS